VSQIATPARSLCDALRENQVYLQAAVCLFAIGLSPAVQAQLSAPASGGDTIPVIRVDSSASVFSSTIVDDSLVGQPIHSDTTSRSQRPRAIEYSDAYHTRLKIHQIGAYVMLPLFVGEYFVGQKLLNSTTRPNGLRSAHSLIAGAVGVVFATNTVTGAWNFWDARKDPKGRTRRDIHSALMLASDAGVLLTAISGSDANHSLANARRHRTIAISSIALSAVGTGMMWLWRD
jgi:hypothetical protein